MKETRETLQELLDYKKRVKYVLMKLHQELEAKDREIKLLETINKELQKKIK